MIRDDNGSGRVQIMPIHNLTCPKKILLETRPATHI